MTKTVNNSNNTNDSAKHRLSYNVLAQKIYWAHHIKRLYIGI